MKLAPIIDDSDYFWSFSRILSYLKDVPNFDYNGIMQFHIELLQVFKENGESHDLS